MDHVSITDFSAELLASFGIWVGKSLLKKRETDQAIMQLPDIADQIVKAQAKLPPGSTVEVSEKGWKVISTTPADPPALEERANARIQVKALIGQLCVENVIAETAAELESAESLQKPDSTWMLRFLGYAEGMTDSYVQELWGKVLAGEIKRPGTFFLRTLDVLSTMTAPSAGSRKDPKRTARGHIDNHRKLSRSPSRTGKGDASPSPRSDEKFWVLREFWDRERCGDSPKTCKKMSKKGPLWRPFTLPRPIGFDKDNVSRSNERGLWHKSAIFESTKY